MRSSTIAYIVLPSLLLCLLVDLVNLGLDMLKPFLDVFVDLESFNVASFLKFFNFNTSSLRERRSDSLYLSGGSMEPRGMNLVERPAGIRLSHVCFLKSANSYLPMSLFVVGSRRDFLIHYDNKITQMFLAKSQGYA
ncbi:hypothetical protein Tco_1338777 [Tanacetum coccineum]